MYYSFIISWRIYVSYERFIEHNICTWWKTKNICKSSTNRNVINKLQISKNQKQTLIISLAKASHNLVNVTYIPFWLERDDICHIFNDTSTTIVVIVVRLYQLVVNVPPLLSSYLGKSITVIVTYIITCEIQNNFNISYSISFWGARMVLLLLL